LQWRENPLFLSPYFKVERRIEMTLKPVMQLEETWETIDAGYCLWIGAGTTMQIAPDGKTYGYWAPGWEDLTKQLEKKAQEKQNPLPPPKSQDYPDRLEVCYNVLGAEPFNTFLRDQYYTQLCVVLLKEAYNIIVKTPSFQVSGEFVPERLRQIASLGQFASPIVSFNIEPLSSFLVARPLGVTRVFPYADVQQKREYARWAAANREILDEFARPVYHPHGLSTGDSIMTRTQYELQKLAIAYRLAVQSAFGTNLIVVGKGLDGEYMFPLITQHRSEINDIIWFASDPEAKKPKGPEPTDEPAKTQYRKAMEKYKKAKKEFETFQKQCADLHVSIALYQQYSDLWAHWQKVRARADGDDTTKAKRFNENLYKAWSLLLEEAAIEAEGGILTVISRFNPEWARQQKLAEKARALGERGKPILIENKAPLDLFSEIRDKIKSPTPQVTALGDIAPEVFESILTGLFGEPTETGSVSTGVRR